MARTKARDKQSTKGKMSRQSMKQLSHLNNPNKKKKKKKKKSKKQKNRESFLLDLFTVCSACHLTLPVSAFSSNQKRKKSPTRRCMSCVQSNKDTTAIPSESRNASKNQDVVAATPGTGPRKRKRGHSQVTPTQALSQKIRIEKPNVMSTSVIDLTSPTSHELIEITSSEDDLPEAGEIIEEAPADLPEAGEIAEEPSADPTPREHSWVIAGHTLKPGDDCEAKFTPNSARWRPAKVLVPGLKGTELKAKHHICVRFNGYTDSVSIPPSQVRAAGSGGARAGMSGRGKEGDSFIGLMSTRDFDETKRRSDREERKLKEKMKKEHELLLKQTGGSSRADYSKAAMDELLADVLQNVIWGQQCATPGRGDPTAATVVQSPLLQLHEEILCFERLMLPTGEEKRARELAVKDLRSCVQSLCLTGVVKVFGSWDTGLTLPVSDIDAVVFQYPGASERLFILADILRKRDLCVDMEVIAKARVPIIKYTHKQTGIHVDVAFDQASGIRTAALTKKYLTEMPAAKPLIIVLKYFLMERNLNETYTGGVGSFLLMLMTRAFLQHEGRLQNEIRRKRHSQDAGRSHESKAGDTDLGSLLLGFFRFFGFDFNYHTVGLDVSGSGSMYSKMDTNRMNFERPALLSVLNPDEPTIDVGSNSYMIGKVQQAFRFGHRELIATMAHPRSTSDRISILSGIICNTRVAKMAALWQPD